MGNTYDTQKPIIEILIEESTPELFDHVFEKICEAYSLTEDEVMVLMLKCDTGEFLRSENGWCFIEKD